MESRFSLAEYLRALQRRKKVALLCFMLVAVASISYAILAKPTYRSSATILIEQQEIPQDLVRSTVTSFADQRIQMTIQRVMTFAKLSELIKKHDLYRDEREKEPLEVVVEQMREDINHRMISAEVVDPRSGRPVEATIAFSIAYQNESAKTAQTVANELTSLFLKENIRNRTEMAEEAESFLSAEVQRLERKSVELERQLAEFKEENLRKLPQLTDLNINLLDRAEREYFDLSRQIQALEERKVYLESQLSQQDPQAATVGDSRDTVLTPAARTRMLQNRYLSLQAKYSDKHPDVIKTKRELDKLIGDGELPQDKRFVNQQLEIYEVELAALRTEYGSEHPEVTALEKTVARFRASADSLQANDSSEAQQGADNPAYVQLAASLEAVKVDLQHFRESRIKAKQKLERLEQSLLDAPAVEQQYRALSRDYENTSRKYQELKSKQLEAGLAKSLEQERKGERFTLIEPPLLPVKPVSPNRPLIVVAGLVFAIAAALGVVFLLEKTDYTIRTQSALKQFTGANPLAVIPHITTVEEMVARKRTNVMVLAALAASLIAVTITVHLALMPLDVLWYVALRKLG